MSGSDKRTNLRYIRLFSFFVQGSMTLDSITFLNEDNIRDFWDNIKHINICIREIPEERKR